MALMQELVRVVEENAESNGISRVTRVHLQVGELTAALPEALRFCFEVLSTGTILEGAELIIEVKQVELFCPGCQIKFIPSSVYALVCPKCGAGDTVIVSGRELCVSSYEGEANDGP